MMYLGDFVRGSAVYVPWNTSGLDGASITRGTDGTLHAYKDGVDSTEVTTGFTNTEDHDSNAGTHLTVIDTSDAFYASGHEFQVKLKGAVIDGKTVNVFIACFSLDRASQVHNRLGAPAGVSISADIAQTYTKVDTEIASIISTLTTIDGRLDTEIPAIISALGSLPDAAAVRDAIFARAFHAKMGALTFEELVAGIAVAQFAKLSGAATTAVTIRNVADNDDAIVATVDADGNRSAVTFDPTAVR